MGFPGDDTRFWWSLAFTETTAQAVPEPMTLTELLAGMIAVAISARRRQRRGRPITPVVEGVAPLTTPS